MNLKKHHSQIVAAFILLVVFIFYVVSNEGEGTLRIVSLAAGNGKAIFIQVPDGNRILIDAGSDASILRALGGVMPFYDRSLDLVIVTDTSQSSIGGMPEVLNNYSVKRYVSVDGLGGGSAYRETQKEIADKKIQMDLVRPGSAISLGDGLSLLIEAEGIFLSDGKNTEKIEAK